MSAPLRPCSTCRTPVPGGRCSAHPPMSARYRPGRGGALYGKRWQALARAVRAAAGHRCAYCGGLATTADHVIPRSRGGTSTADNAAAACGPCNSSKGDRTLAEWIASGCAPDGARRVLAERMR